MSAFTDIKNYFFPMSEQQASTQTKTALSPNRYISPVQFQRLKVDIKSLSDAISEAELAYYPHRVKLQRIYQDTIRNGQIAAAMQRRKDLTLLKDFAFLQGEKVDEKTTQLFDSEWFYLLLSHILDAKFFGYSLIGLGNVEGDEFTDIQLVKRWNVNPGTYTMKPYLNSYVYSLSGINFTDPNYKDDEGNSYYDWTLWVTTPTETGATPCGYGLLYKLAYYEILMRNNLGFNATANERFGMPIIWAKTTKSEETGERANFEAMVSNIGSAGGLVTDPTDEIEFIESSKGKGADLYASLEERLQKMINKVVFGHADSLDSQTGKLGGEDAAKEAIEAIEKVDNRWVANIINTQLIPKMQTLGFNIPVGSKFTFLNDKEKEEQRVREDERNKLTSEVVMNLKNSGYEVDEKYISERTGIPLKKVEQPTGLSEGVKTKLRSLYGG